MKKFTIKCIETEPDVFKRDWTNEGFTFAEIIYLLELTRVDFVLMSKQQQNKQDDSIFNSRN